MQLDMHYYGTWYMAFAAGLKAEICTTIATAAQFVDDNAHDGDHGIVFTDGARVDVQPSAHHTSTTALHFVSKSADEKAWEQRQIWVPFHFLPGNEGDSYTERLKCRKDSVLAQEMVENALANIPKLYGAELLGITAHVYADTFSHYGFSGVSSRRNKVFSTSFEFLTTLEPSIEKYIKDKADLFFKKYGEQGGLVDNIKSWFSFEGALAEIGSGALGHGPVATYPDRPYLHWKFDYEHPTRTQDDRNNPETFFEACEKLYNMFRKAGNLYPDWRSNHSPIDFLNIADAVRDILAVQENEENRSKAWIQAGKEGKLAHVEIQASVYNPDHIILERNALNGTDDSSKALDTFAYRFYQAAAYHRTYVIRDLMPSHGLVID